MKKMNWPVIGVISVVAILLLFGCGMMMGGWGYGSGSMMDGSGNGRNGMTLAPGASASMNNWGYPPVGWIGLLFMRLIPVGLVALAGFGIFWLVRKASQSTPPSF